VAAAPNQNNDGGPGGGGRIVLGSAIDNIAMNGLIEAFGGTSSSFLGGGGTLTFVSSANPTFGTSGSFNGFTPLTGPRDDSDVRSSMSLSDLLLAGGGGGAGGGGDGTVVPEPATTVAILVACGGMALWSRRKITQSRAPRQQPVAQFGKAPLPHGRGSATG
jgi:hypothetical protein